MSKNIIKSKDSKEDNPENVTQKSQILRAESSETRSILKHKDGDHSDYDDTESRKDSVKKLQFDESVIEIKSSYADPVDPEELRMKLESLQKLQSLRRQSVSVGPSKHVIGSEDVNRQSNINEEHNEPNTTPQETFELRRKQFYKDEYKHVLLFNDVPSSSSILSNDIGCPEENEQ